MIVPQKPSLSFTLRPIGREGSCNANGDLWSKGQVVRDGGWCGMDGCVVWRGIRPANNFHRGKKNDLHDGLVELLLLSFFFSLCLFQCLAGGQAGGPVTARIDAPQCRQPGRVQWAGGGGIHGCSLLYFQPL